MSGCQNSASPSTPPRSYAAKYCRMLSTFSCDIACAVSRLLARLRELRRDRPQVLGERLARGHARLVVGRAQDRRGVHGGYDERREVRLERDPAGLRDLELAA